MKRAKGTIDGMNPKVWMDYMLDHTTIIAEDDPEFDNFTDMDARGIIQMRVIPGVGAERFAEYFYNKLNTFISKLFTLSLSTFKAFSSSIAS